MSEEPIGLFLIFWAELTHGDTEGVKQALGDLEEYDADYTAMRLRQILSSLPDDDYLGPIAEMHPDRFEVLRVWSNQYAIKGVLKQLP